MTSSSERAFRVVEPLAPRTPGVVESLCVWQPGRRPAGAPPIVRLSVEEELPTCYEWMMPNEVRDLDRRTFNPYRAVRRGALDEMPFSIQPDVGGVRADELLERLGSGDVDFGLLVHVAHALAEHVLLLWGSRLADAVLGGSMAAELGQRRRTETMARPVTLAHIALGFDGDLAIDVVTDGWNNARGVPHDQREARLAGPRFRTALEHWTDRTNDVIAGFVRELAGPRVDVSPLLYVDTEQALDALGTFPMLPSGRRALVDMLAVLFPERARHLRDLREAP